jgi:hypothetical protein
LVKHCVRAVTKQASHASKVHEEVADKHENPTLVLDEDVESGRPLVEDNAK